MTFQRNIVHSLYTPYSIYFRMVLFCLGFLNTVGNEHALLKAASWTLLVEQRLRMSQEASSTAVM